MEPDLRMETWRDLKLPLFSALIGQTRECPVAQRYKNGETTKCHPTDFINRTSPLSLLRWHWLRRATAKDYHSGPGGVSNWTVTEAAPCESPTNTHVPLNTAMPEELVVNACLGNNLVKGHFSHVPSNLGPASLSNLLPAHLTFMFFPLSDFPLPCEISENREVHLLIFTDPALCVIPEHRSFYIHWIE